MIIGIEKSLRKVNCATSPYTYNQSQTEIGHTLKTLKGSRIGRSKYGVGKSIGGSIYVYKDYENWRIIDSYKIDNTNDMKDIITALINIYPIPSKDYNSYRSVEDMLQEWEIHNFAYNMLPDDSSGRGAHGLRGKNVLVLFDSQNLSADKSCHADPV